jgi:hypothetical protein
MPMGLSLSEISRPSHRGIRALIKAARRVQDLGAGNRLYSGFDQYLDIPP